MSEPANSSSAPAKPVVRVHESADIEFQKKLTLRLLNNSRALTVTFVIGIIALVGVIALGSLGIVETEPSAFLVGVISWMQGVIGTQIGSNNKALQDQLRRWSAAPQDDK